MGPYISSWEMANFPATWDKLPRLSLWLKVLKTSYWQVSLVTCFSVRVWSHINRLVQLLCFFKRGSPYKGLPAGVHVPQKLKRDTKNQLLLRMFAQVAARHASPLKKRRPRLQLQQLSVSHGAQRPGRPQKCRTATLRRFKWRFWFLSFYETNK